MFIVEMKQRILNKDELVPWYAYTAGKVYATKLEHKQFHGMLDVELEFCECPAPDISWDLFFKEVESWLKNKQCPFIEELRAPTVESKFNEYPLRFCLLISAMLQQEDCFESLRGSFMQLGDHYFSKLKSVDAKVSIGSVKRKFEELAKRLEVAK